MSTKLSQAAFVLSYFQDRPMMALRYDDWTDDLAAEYKAQTGVTARHFRSVARRLASQGKLIKVRNGVYLYDPEYALSASLRRNAKRRKASKSRLSKFNLDNYVTVCSECRPIMRLNR